MESFVLGFSAVCSMYTRDGRLMRRGCEREEEKEEDEKEEEEEGVY